MKTIKKVLILVFFSCFALYTSVQAQDTCPRIWQNNDTLFTDAAPKNIWFAGDSAVNAVSSVFFVPEAADTFSVLSSGEMSKAFAWNADEYPVEYYEMFPNPVKDTVTFSTNSKHPSTIEIFDVTGWKVLPLQTLTISKTKVVVTNWQPGLYIVQWKTYWGETFTIKLVKE